MTPAPPPRPVPRGGRPAAPRPGRGTSPEAPGVPAARLPVRRPGVLPAAGVAGALDVLWLVGAAGAAVAVGGRSGTPAAALGVALVLLARLGPAALLPAGVLARAAALPPVVPGAVRGVAALLVLVVLATTAGAWPVVLVALLVLLAEAVRPPARGAVGGEALVVAAALPVLAVAVVLGALGRGLDAAVGVLAPPGPVLLLVAVGQLVLAARDRRSAAPSAPAAVDRGAARPDRGGATPASAGGGARELLAALRAVVASARGAARCAALAPVVVAAALAPVHATALGAGSAGSALLLLALAGGGLGGSAVAVRWPAAGSAPGSVLALAAGGAAVAVLVAGPTTDLVVSAVLLAVAGACAGAAVVASRGLPPVDGAGGQVAPGARRTAEGLVLGAVAVLAPLLAAVLGPVRFPLGAAGDLDVDGAGVVMVLVGLAAVVAAGVVVRPLADRPAGPLLPALLARASEVGTGAGTVAPPSTGGSPAPSEPPAAAPHGLPGVLVALEGGDGAGKSTQVRLLGEALRARGVEVVVTREPGATALGARVRGLLLDPSPGAPAVPPRAEALLYAADRAAHVAEVVRPALARGAVVVTDRYADSSLAYQGAGRALPAAEVAELSRWATEGLLPDRVVVLDLTAAAAAARREGRGAADRLDGEPAAFHERVRSLFLDLARAGGSRYAVVDADGGTDEVARRVRAAVAPLVPALVEDEDEGEGPGPLRDHGDGGVLRDGPLDRPDDDGPDDDGPDDDGPDDDGPDDDGPDDGRGGPPDHPAPAPAAAPPTAVVPVVAAGSSPAGRRSVEGLGGPATEPVDVVPPPAPRGAPDARRAQAADDAHRAAEDVERQRLERQRLEEQRLEEARLDDERRREARRLEDEQRARDEEVARRAAEEAEQRRLEEERQRLEDEQREAERVRAEQAERERVETERAAAQQERAERRAGTSVRSAEAAVATARGLGDARRPVAAPAAAPTAPPPAPLSVRLPQERLDRLPDAVQRSAVEVAQAQRDARTGALALAEQQRADAERARRRAEEEARLAERAARERAAAAEAAEHERQQAELMARREAEEARAEEERREASRRRAATERVAPAGERAAGTGTAALPVVDAPGADGRPGLQELQAADRRREAQQRARRRAAASRGGAPAGRARRSRHDGEGALADELFSWQEERDERRLARRAERRGEVPGGPDGPGGTDEPGGTGPR